MLVKQLRWIIHYRATLLALLLGVVMATSLAATGPVLIEQVLTFALRRVLLNAPVEETNLRISLRESLTEGELAELNGRLRPLLNTHFAALPHETVATGILPTLIPWRDEQIFTDQRVNVQFYDADVRSRINVLDGAWPLDAPLAPNVYAIVIGEPLAEAYDLGVGDTLFVSKQSSATVPDIQLEVAAIVEPLNGQDAFWFGAHSPLRTRADGRFRHFGALVTPETFRALTSTHFADQSPVYMWYVLIDANRLSLVDTAVLQAQLTTLTDQLFEIDRQLQLATALPERLSDFSQNADAVRTPLTLLTATSTLLAFFFVGMVATLAGVQLHAEWALQRSRGVGEASLFLTLLWRTALLLLIALLLGVQLSDWLLLRLAQTGPLAEIREPNWLFTRTEAVWQPALLAALICLLLILWPFIRSRNQPVTRRLEALYRPERVGWFQRFYIDVIVVAVGLILLVRFVGQGGLIQTTGAVRGADWLLVLAPIATMIGGLTILLRLFPRLLVGLTHLYRRWPRSAPYLALMYAARFHQQSTRLVLLFALTVALGIFASSVDDALSHNEAVRARYATGGSVRLIGVGRGVDESGTGETAVWRGDAVIDSVFNERMERFDVLAIDPDTFAQTVSFRSGFAEQPLDALLERLKPPVLNLGNSLPIPLDSEKLGLWLAMPSDDPEHWQGISIDVKLGTDGAGVALLPLRYSGVTDGAWRYFETALPNPTPTQLNSIWLRSRTYSPEFRENLAYDDITVEDSAGNKRVIEGFEGTNQAGHQGLTWFRVVPQQDAGVFYSPSNFEPRSGNTRLEISFGRTGTTPGVWYGAAPFDFEAFTPPRFPILVSRRFAETTNSQIGSRMTLSVRQSAVSSQLVLAEVVGVVDYFPTMYERSETGYIITLRDPLLAVFNATRHETMQSNELLMREPPQPALLNQAAQIITVTEVAQTLRAFPLAVGLRAASLLSYVLATAITLGGFVAHLVFTVTQRRGHFVVLRALGLNGNQLYGVLLIEQIVLVISGVLLGTGLGLLLTWLTLNNLNFDWGGIADAPAFEVVWDWRALLRTYALFALLIIVALSTAVLIIRRTGVQRSLRVGVE